MASSTSLKELSKAINAFIVQPTAPLPENLVDTIAAYLRRHEKYDDAASDRLQEELLVIFHKHVKGNPAAVGGWFGIVRRLLPVLQTPERITQWFDACEGMWTSSARDKGSVDETVAALMDLITLADEYQDTPDGHGATNPFIDRLFLAWLDRVYPASIDGTPGMQDIERMVREALSQFGKRRPKEFFTSLDNYFMKKQYRKSALRFFCDYIQGQPPHLHTVQQTPMFSNLLRCLQTDTSTAIISAALTALIMLLPHMPGSLVPHLPTLFNIYARILFWGPESSRGARLSIGDGDAADQTWELCEYVPDLDDVSLPQLSNYYTILYGLYPINFMDYIRKPQRYLRHANDSAAEDLEIQPSEIRHNSEKFRRCHLLHPNFYTLTIESEKTDFGRWIKSEAAEVVAECMGLCLAPESGYVAVPLAPIVSDASITPMNDVQEKDVNDPALLSTSGSFPEAWRNAPSISTDAASSHRTPSIMIRQNSQASFPSNRDLSETQLDSPTFPTNLAKTPSQSQLQDMLHSNKTIKSNLNQSLPNDSVPSLSLSQHETAAERSTLSNVLPQGFANSPMSLTDANSASQVAHLQRQILMLQNDLSFERYLKQQHMAHIGDLRRRQVVEAAAEAETQNLIITNRNLKSRYEEAKKTEMQVRKESEKGRALAKKWEADLANKLKNLRDESKKTHSQLDLIQRELEESRTEADKLRRMVCDAEVKELNWKQNAQSIELHAAEIDRLKGEVDRLTVSERDHQAKEIERETALNSAVEAENKVETLRMSLAAQESEVKRTRTLFQAQIATLQSKLAEAQELREQVGRPAPNVDIENDLAASRAKQAEMEKQHNLLLRKYTALQSSLLDMQSGADPYQVNADAPSGAKSVSDHMSSSTSPSTVKTRPHRGLSNPESPGAKGGAAYNVTPALGWKSTIPTSPGTMQQQRPATPMGIDTVVDGAPPSPDQRYHGRGGVQNRNRKEGKEKHKDDGASSSGTGTTKKEKKSTGLRGIRGLV